MRTDTKHLTGFDAHVQAFRRFRRGRIEAWFIDALATDTLDLRLPPRSWWLTEADYVH